MDVAGTDIIATIFKGRAINSSPLESTVKTAKSAAAGIAGVKTPTTSSVTGSVRTNRNAFAPDKPEIRSGEAAFTQ